MIVSKTRRTLRASATLLVGSTLLLGLSACGTATSGDTALKEDSNLTIEQWRADIDGCMLGAGFDIGGSGGDGPSGSVDISKFDMEAFDKAYATCIKKIGDAPVDENQPTEDEMFEVQLVFAKCMRDAGYDYPDPAKGAMSPAFGPETDPKVLDACSEKANKAVTGK